MTGKVFLVLLIAATFVIVLSDATENATNTSIPTYSYEIIKTYPHDRSAFTEGLVYDKGVFYESTGLYGKSTLRKVDIETGEVLKRIYLPAQYFGEGLALWKDKLAQLTWESGFGLVYDKESLKLVGNFTYKTKGWGLTSDGKHLIMSDGTDTLYILSPETFGVLGQIKVKDNGVPIKNINELEYVKGEIYANIWPTNKIAIISPENGRVKAWINLDGLLSKDESRDVDVLNGIAYDPDGDRLFVTGKFWPSLFEIKLAAKGEGNYSIP